MGSQVLYVALGFAGAVPLTEKVSSVSNNSTIPVARTVVDGACKMAVKHTRRVLGDIAFGILITI